MEGDMEEDLLLVEAELQDMQDQIKALLEHQERLYERKSHLRSLLGGLKESENISTEENAVPVAAEDWSGTFEWDSRADDI